MIECDVFEEGSRRWLICRGEAGLAPHKVNAYRARWGMEPLFPEEDREVSMVRHEVPELVFHGYSVESVKHGIEKPSRGCGCGKKK